jgi:RHS repeat-associated protein
LSSISGAVSRTYSYDAAGHTTGYAGLTFGYSDEGRLKTISGGATATYQHNALGERVKKVASATTTYFVYDEAGQLIGEYDCSGNLIQETVWLNGIPVATLRPNGSGIDVYYVHTDHLNTPRRVTRPSDNVIVWRWDSDPFGTTAANENPDGDATSFTYNLRFPGQYRDAETGLNYNYFRDYDPVIGRYIESDPIGLRGGLNPYVYAGTSPVLFVDPDGLLFCTYQIDAHTLKCENNKGESLIISGGDVKSGQGECQDKSECTDQKDIGPLPVGKYTIYSASQTRHHNPRRKDWMFLGPDRGNDMRASNGELRGAFFIHPGVLSNGCIVISLSSSFETLSRWAEQDDGGRLSVTE